MTITTYLPHNQGQPDGLLTSAEVCKASGLNYRKLDYWVKRGYVEPVNVAKGSGSQRLFNPAVVYTIQDRLDAISHCPSCN